MLNGKLTAEGREEGGTGPLFPPPGSTPDISLSGQFTNHKPRPYAPINIMPHYPPPGRYRGQHRGIDIENQAPDRGICIRYLSNPLSFPHPGSGDLTDEAGPTLREVDEFISQIPT